MLTDNNQIIRNCFVIIYCHLTKVLSQINKCIIFEPNKLYNTIYSMVVLPKSLQLSELVTTTKYIVAL